MFREFLDMVQRRCPTFGGQLLAKSNKLMHERDADILCREKWDMQNVRMGQAVEIKTHRNITMLGQLVYIEKEGHRSEEDRETEREMKINIKQHNSIASWRDCVTGQALLLEHGGEVVGLHLQLFLRQGCDVISQRHGVVLLERNRNGVGNSCCCIRVLSCVMLLRGRW